MTDYFIGDLQGCYDGLQQSLAEIEFNKGKDTLWLTGDLVARGENSLATLEFVKQNDSSIQTVLGNHDLHFLSVANGIKTKNPKDKLEDLLNHADIHQYCDWLRHQPMLLELPDNKGYMSHAGLPPNWSTEDAVYYSAKLEHILRSKTYIQFLSNMYTNTPALWSQNLLENEQLVYAVNGLTRMRYCSKEGTLDLNFKDSPDSLPNDSELIPWFDFDNQRFSKIKWIFGHWASLMGKSSNPNIIPLDTGYVWGNYFTILNWQTQETVKVPACINKL